MGGAGDALEDFLNSVQKAFLARDTDFLLRLHTLPLPVYTVVGVVIIRTEEEFRDRTLLYRELVGDAVRSDLVILERTAMRNGRFSVTTRWSDVDSKGEPGNVTELRYFLLETGPNTWQIEMLEYIQEPLPYDAVDRIIH